MTALMWAAYEGHEEVCIALVKKGARYDVKDIYGDDAMALADQQGFGEMMTRIVDQHAPQPQQAAA